MEWNPDIVYHRADLWYPCIARLARRIALVLEINTDDLREYCLSPGLRCVYNRLTRGLLLGGSAGLVYVSRGIANLPHFRVYNKQHIIIGNGVSLRHYTQLPKPCNPTPRLVFIGKPGHPWHGLDKILLLAERKGDWVFDIIGPTDYWRNVPNVTFHGPLRRAEYEPILAKSDIAIGPLALHRIGITEGSSLKVREYLAYGLPVILEGKDTDFPGPVPFILELPSSEDNVIAGMASIEAFVRAWQGRRVPREWVSHLDIECKEKIRLSFLREVLDKLEESHFS
jgi:glycosyltransferase involved in cell wall biosynthesis